MRALWLCVDFIQGTFLSEKSLVLCLKNVASYLDSLAILVLKLLKVNVIYKLHYCCSHNRSISDMCKFRHRVSKSSKYVRNCSFTSLINVGLKIINTKLKSKSFQRTVCRL
jgi:hypothetical protein